MSNILDNYQIKHDKLKTLNYNVIKKNIDIYEENIDKKQFEKIIDSKYIDFIISIIKKYVLIYMILYYSISNSISTIKFINEILSIKEIKDIISQIIDGYYFTLGVIYVIDNYEKINNIDIQLKYKDNIKFLTHFSSDIIKTMFLKSNKNRIHNIIKSIIYNKYYNIIDKSNIINILIENELYNSEIKYIDVVYEIKNISNINDFYIDTLLKNIKLSSGYKIDLNNLLVSYNEVKSIDKIKYLIENKLIYPIVDDFLRYNNNNYVFKKSLTISQINVILNNINEVIKNGIPKVDTNKRSMILKNIFIENYVLNNIKNYNLETEYETYKELSNFTTNPYIQFEQNPDTYLQYKNDNNIEIVRKNTLISNLLETHKNYNIINIIGFFKNLNYNNKTISEIKKFYNFIETDVDNVYYYYNENDDSLIDNNFEINYSSKETIITSLFNIYYNEYMKKIYASIKFKHTTIYDKENVLMKYNFLPKTYLNDVILNVINNYSRVIYNPFIEKMNDTIILPTIDNINTSLLIQYNLTLDKPSILINESEIIDSKYLCQHFVTWNDLYKLQFVNKDLYAKMFDEFKTKYIKQEIGNKSITCKSCGSELTDLYNNLVSYQSIETVASIKNLSHLEDNENYSKYNRTIKNIDKIVEKLADIFGLKQYTGSSSVNKSKRNNIVFMVIELTIQQSQKLVKNYNERQEIIKKSQQKYGISNKSDFLLFPLDDNLFLTTLAELEVDKYKHKKINTIISYIIIMFILNINKLQLISLHNDKSIKKNNCNISIFEKYNSKIFHTFNIIINKENDFEQILKYKSLCFVIYYFICNLVNYKIWQGFSYNKNYNLELQDIIINTLINTLNNILEQYQITYIYDLIKNLFFNQMNTLFIYDDVLTKHKEFEDNLKYKNLIKIKKSNLYFDKIILTGSLPSYKDINYKINVQCLFDLYQIKSHFINNILFDNISTLTNCPSGLFHKWNYSKNLECLLCGNKLSNIIETTNDNLLKNYKENVIKKFYLYKYKNTDTPENMKNAILNLKKLNLTNTYSLIKTIKTNVFEKIELNLSMDIINIFTTKYIKSVNNNDSYILANDIENKSINPIQINYTKINYKFNTHFNKYVIECNHYKIMYFDALDFKFLGYKDNDKIINVTSTNKLIVQYGFINKLKLLGLYNYIIKLNEIDDFNEFIQNYIFKFKQLIISIRNIIYTFKYTATKNVLSSQDFSEKIKKYDFYKKYENITKNLELENYDEKYIKIFDNIENILDNFEYTYPKNSEQNIDTLYINFKKIDFKNDLLYYLISQFMLLLDINKNNNLVEFFIIDIINYIFDENKPFKNEKFIYYLLTLKEDIVDTSFYDEESLIEKTQEDIESNKDKQEDIEEEITSIDDKQEISDIDDEDYIGENNRTDINNIN